MSPSAFISYSWDDDAHKEWVRALAERLRADGVDITLDRWGAAPGDQLPAFMERAIRKNQFVVIVCTPRYKSRSDAREGGVGYEGCIMTAEAMTKHNDRKFIPVWRSGTWAEAAPSWLAGKIHVRLTGEPYSERDYEVLLRTLLGTRETAPPLGVPMATVKPGASLHWETPPSNNGAGKPGRSTRAGSRWLWAVPALFAVLAVTAWRVWGPSSPGLPDPVTRWGSPDLVVTDLSVDPTSDPAGSEVTVGLTIRNQGERTSEACSVTFDIQGSGMIDEFLGSNPVPTIEAGKIWEISTSMTIMPHRKVGEGSIIARIDRAGKLSESEADRVNNTRSVPFTVAEPTARPVLAAGLEYSLAVAADGTVWAWGNNSGGQLGDGTTTWGFAPVQVKGMNDVIAIASGFGHTLALRSDGTVWAWGRNRDGQLGDGTTPLCLIPVQVQGVNDVIAIAGGVGHTLALSRDGTVWAWGLNRCGQLGDGTRTRCLTPVQVKAMSDVDAIVAGFDHTVALRSDGTVWAWGKNLDGQLGDQNKADHLIPVQVQGISDVIVIAGGKGHTVALRSDWTVWAWGWNYYGQLGDGTTIERSTPVQVKRIGDVVAIAGGEFHTVALCRDGTVWAWGWNYYGQLGDGTTTNSSIPVQVQGISDVVAIASGFTHALALCRDGTVWAWGQNNEGQLGDGTFTNSSIPVQVQELPHVDR